MVYGDGLAQSLGGAEVSQAVAESLQQAHADADAAAVGHGQTQGPSNGGFNRGGEAATPEVEIVLQPSRAPGSRIASTIPRHMPLVKRALRSRTAAGTQPGLQQGAQEWGNGGRDGKELLRVEGEAA